MGTPLGPKYIPYTYMDPLGTRIFVRRLGWRSLAKAWVGQNEAASIWLLNEYQ